MSVFQHYGVGVKIRFKVQRAGRQDSHVCIKFGELAVGIGTVDAQDAEIRRDQLWEFDFGQGKPRAVFIELEPHAENTGDHGIVKQSNDSLWVFQIAGIEVEEVLVGVKAQRKHADKRRKTRDFLFKPLLDDANRDRYLDAERHQQFQELDNGANGLSLDDVFVLGVRFDCHQICGDELFEESDNAWDEIRRVEHQVAVLGAQFSNIGTSHKERDKLDNC
ncbi:hypothetical protein WICPIJ_000133 [Wickerhamomyces pijperi]|uniref:Uncharacterized protein n=1 Tax=Wickerhamomyces pijperi TaxID=599730 RepID=A0A9P8QEF7_WICPI|nr:hypothetical protein WICPIJ_000133 [Wickerhamomyces pijperi]